MTTTTDLIAAKPDDTEAGDRSRYRTFAAATGWRVDWQRPIGCWHVAVGRRCPGRTGEGCPDPIGVIRRDVQAIPQGPADYFYTNPLDHPRRAWSPTGERVLLASPYVLDQRGAVALTGWCQQRRLSWTAVPISWYYPDATLSVIVRTADSDLQIDAWVPELRA